MADNIEYISIDDAIKVQGDNNISTIIGTLRVDYATNTVTGTLTAQKVGANDMATFSPMTLEVPSPGSRMYRITTGADGANPNGNSITIFYNGESPSVVNIAYSLNGVTYGYNDESVQSSTTPPVCFAKGTLIRTTKGEVRIEDLKVGDECVTSSGKARPIRWLGHRDIRCDRYDLRASVLPVRIAASSFGHESPSRDLYLSPGHSICVDVLGEVLIPAASLINGSTIVQEDVEVVSYWHVELDSHDIVVAENLACESYLQMDNRGFFAEHDVVDLASLPDAEQRGRTHADFCRPFHADGAVVDSVRARLETIASKRLIDSQPLSAGEVKAALALVA